MIQMKLKVSQSRKGILLVKYISVTVVLAA